MGRWSVVSFVNPTQKIGVETFQLAALRTAPSLEARVRSESQMAAPRGSKADLRTNGNAMHPVDC